MARISIRISSNEAILRLSSLFKTSATSISGGSVHGEFEPAHRCSMKLCSVRTAWAALPAVFLLASLSMMAQDQPSEGVNVGNYNIQQSLEFGGRVTNLRGNTDVYDTFVNLGSGLRLYDQTLSMRSLNHNGSLFDNLYVSSFGYGGDPNDATRLRMYKNKWYDFSGSFRRDKYFWDYGLLANPLNPPTSNPSLILTNSPHLFDTARRMSDFRLTLLPQSRVRVRLGYSRNIDEGPSLTTIHEGTETDLFQQVKTTSNSYQVGLDFHLLPRTTFSYDQFLNDYKGDTSIVDQNLNYTLSNGVPVDLGIAFNTAATQPCAVPLTNAATTPPTASAACNAFISYSRVGAPRTSQPTEQVSFESNYFHNLNMAGRASYSAATDNVLGYDEIFNGSITRSLQRGLTTSGVVGSRRVSATADWAATYTVTQKLRIVDEFRFNNYRLPGALDFIDGAQFPQAAVAPATTANNLLLLPVAQFTPAACPAPFTAATCPQHNSSSGADLAIGSNVTFLGEDTKYNTFRVEYDFTKRFGGSIGYRLGYRDISDFSATAYQAETYDPGGAATAAASAALARRGDCALVSGALPAACTVNADGSVTFSGLAAGSDSARSMLLINEDSALMGLWARPTDTVRVNFDLELFSSDRVFDRVDPRNLQHYKLRTTYKPRNWMSFAGTLNIQENRDNVALIGNIQHNRNYGFSAALEPNDRLSFDLGYEYNDLFSMSDICFALSGTVPTGSTPCPLVSGTGPIEGISEYAEKTNFAYFSAILKPMRRVTATLGYALDSVTGGAPVLDPTTGLPVTLNPLTPAGPLSYNYHKPYAKLAVQLAKNVTGKVAWGWYNYDEKAALDPTGPRSFRANLVDFTVRYEF
jgi:hypothetical protein